MISIYSTDKIEQLLDYLESEITKYRLDHTLAKMYLYALWDSRLDDETILQPKWTFAIPDFNKYLGFYRKYNLLHWGGSQTKFSPDQDLYSSYSVAIELKDDDDIETLLVLAEKIPEFQNYFCQVEA